MFEGSVTFIAAIKGNGLTFPLCVFNPNELGVDKITIEGPNGDEICSTIHLVSVASLDEGRTLAEKVNTAALNRIAYFHNIAIENARLTGSQFFPLHPQSGVHLAASIMGRSVTKAAKVVIGLPAGQLQIELEQSSPPGERNYGLFRSARQSMGPVEEFMHLYNILLMLHNDSQPKVDAFIIAEDPAVPQTQQPSKLPRGQRMETVYTRLRNELAHQRVGVNIDNTKVEMARRLSDLRMLTKRAIELHP